MNPTDSGKCEKLKLSDERASLLIARYLANRWQRLEPLYHDAGLSNSFRITCRRSRVWKTIRILEAAVAIFLTTPGWF
jgi:hypothetical protein